MLRALASLFFAFGILGLFQLNRDPDSRTSKALWIPVTWLLIIGSRSVSQWLGLAPTDAEQAIIEGNPFDRVVYLGLLTAGIVVLLHRGRAVGTLLRANGPIVLYFLYCVMSLLWSDYPDVAFKRWIKALGDIVMVLVVLTDPDWLAALKRLITRASFVLLPSSILVDMFRQHYALNGAQVWMGVTTNKNTFGVDCLVLGLGSLWCFLESRRQGGPRRAGPMIAQGTMVLIALFLVLESNSMTSLSCLVMAGGVVLPAGWGRKPAVVHPLVVAVLALSLS